MWTASFWTAAVERAVKTAAQALVALLGAEGLGLHTAPWGTAVSIAGLAAVLSVLTSIASAGAGDPDTPSLVRRQL
jgi:hypothetical protein